MLVAEARAIEPALVVQSENPNGDRRALERLAVWMERFSPIVGLEENAQPECLLLDITGCADCFHGEDRLIQRALHELNEEGWDARAAIADTVGAAWGLARYVRSWYVAPAGEIDQTFLSLPLDALRLPAEAVATLTELGIESIRQLQALPRTGVPGRFGPLVLQRLDQALGMAPELIVPHRTPPDVQARCSFEYPTDQRQALLHAITQLLERVTATLRRRRRGARQLECWLYHETSASLRIDVGLFRPSQSPEHLGKLLETRLEQAAIAEPVRGICLRVPVLEIMPERQEELFDPEECRAEEFSVLIDQLASRLGREAITFARLVPDPQPEYACRFEPAMAACRLALARCPASAKRQAISDHRPVQVWPKPIPIEVIAAVPDGPPARLRWQGQDYASVRSWGPERIETGWWRGQDVHRDYFIVQTDWGARFWVFRRHEDGRWFLHGAFD
jgi:protein ImuB